MEKCWRCVLQRKRSISFAILIYFVIMYFVYTVYWKKASLGATLQLVNSFVNDAENADGNRSEPSSFASLWQKFGVGSGSLRDESNADIHLEDAALGHTSELANGNDEHIPINNPKGVAIGLGITSKGIKDVAIANIARTFQLFTTFLPTFCQTAKSDYIYSFYLAYDHTDNLFKEADFLNAFHRAFVETTNQLCMKGDNGPIRTALHMVQCSHDSKPAWAQNDAMLEAYLDNSEYYYRVNDDTKLLNAGWTEAFVDVLTKYTPINVGVVGPTHSGGNTQILTYDFVNRKHVDIFGFYYPRLFTDWWGDDWVTEVYKPGRMTKLKNIRLAHTLGLGQRYGVHWDVQKKLAAQIAHDKITLNRYIKYASDNGGKSPTEFQPDGRRVVAVSLFGRNPRHTWGAIRNAQTVQLFFPSWTYRVFVAGEDWRRRDPSLIVPARILAKLRQLGADVVNVTTPDVPPQLWRYLIIDSPIVEWFTIRDADMRFSDREVEAVNNWLKISTSLMPPSKQMITSGGSAMNTTSAALHCFRDTPLHATQPIVDGLWGGRTDVIRAEIKVPVSNIIASYITFTLASNTTRNISSLSTAFLREVLWPLFVPNAYCHDSYGVCKWPGTVQFPTVRGGSAYIGQKFDAHQEPLVSPEISNATDCQQQDVGSTVNRFKFLFSQQLVQASAASVVVAVKSAL